MLDDHGNPVKVPMDELGGLTAEGLIHALRGDPPALCDFCNRSAAPGNMLPEEAGQWACRPCVTMWEAQDKCRDLEAKLAEREAWFEKCIAMWKQEEVMWKERETELLATLDMKWAGTKPE